MSSRDVTPENMCGHSSLQIVAVLPWEVQKVIFQLYSVANSIKQPHVIFHGIHHLRHRSCILLTYVTVSVQSDLILPKLQQHLFQMNCIRCVVCECGTQTTSFSLCTLNIRCNVGWLVIFLSL